jgi:hypothetical protein
MPKLDHHVLTLGMSEFDYLSEILNLAIFPQTVVFGCNSAIWQHGGGFHGSKTRATLDYTSHMGHVPHCVAGN